MNKERSLAYTDAIIAILVTIMVLEFKIPHSGDWSVLRDMRYIFLSYVLSFLYLSIYRNNHHNTFHIVEKVNGTTLWLNNLLIFCLSLIPFATAWMAENHFDHNPVIFYGIVLLACATSYYFLLQNLKKIDANQRFSHAFSSHTKDIISIAWYLIGIILEVFHYSGGLFMYFLVALIRLIPEKRAEKNLND